MIEKAPLCPDREKGSSLLLTQLVRLQHDSCVEWGTLACM